MKTRDGALELETAELLHRKIKFNQLQFQVLTAALALRSPQQSHLTLEKEHTPTVPHNHRPLLPASLPRCGDPHHTPRCTTHA